MTLVVDRRTAAEARRQRVLALGDTRMAQILTTIAGQDEANNGGSEPSAAQATNDLSDSTKAGETLTNSVEMPPKVTSTTKRDVHVPPIRQIASSSFGHDTSRHRKVGTAADAKWSEYVTPRSQTPLRGRCTPISAADSLSVATSASSSFRLIIAFIFGILLSFIWGISGMRLPSLWRRRRQRAALAQAWQSVVVKMGNKGWEARLRLLVARLSAVAITEGGFFLAKSQVAASVASLHKYPPMFLLLVVEAGVIAITFVVLNFIAPSFVRKRARHTAPSIISRVLTALAPRLRPAFAHAAVWQETASSLVDDGACLIMTLVLCQLMPVVLSPIL
jgi:hypothetical protein